MKKPFFSIITCTYNSAKFVQKNIDSVKQQSFSDYEHVFIDGCSKDKTKSVIKKYQRQAGKKVRFYQTKPQGISHAFNFGIKKAKGKYLIHLNSDDNFADQKVLQDVHDFLVTHDLPDWIYAKAKVINQDRKLIGIHPRRWFLQQANAYLLKFFNFIPHQTVFIKKKIFEKYGGFRENLIYAMDQEMWLRLRNKTQWLFFDRAICDYMVREGANSSDPANLARNRKIYKQMQQGYMNWLEFQASKLISYFIQQYNQKVFQDLVGC
ncbi:MAG: glycosyltransferase [Candidatus Pacebacteria bacterium]|nr:glycosyltransferase [Candidatus Paceibacterota bacterium]